MAEDASKFLGPPHTAGYRPAVFGGYMFQSLFTGQWPMFMVGEVEAMRYDPKVQLATAILRAPLHQFKWTVKAQRPEVQQYVDATLKKVWQTSLLKLANYMDYGHVGGEVVWKEQQGYIVFDQLRDVYPRDTVPLIDHKKGGVVGLQVKSSFGSGNSGAESQASNLINLFGPRAFWVAHRARYAGYYGYSRYNGAWWPWLEKRARHGATDVRRLWFIKNAYQGAIIRHPPGYIERPDGTLQSNQDYAREIVEKIETGGVLALPNAKNPGETEYQWTLERPTPNGDVSGIREYAGDLDREILEGFEIPPEVVDASESGSGWSGRSVPFMVFLSGEDEIAAELLQAVKTWIIDPGVEVNFGPGQIYAIEPVSFVRLLAQVEGEPEPEGKGEPKPQPAKPGQAPQPNPEPPSPNRPATAKRVQMSLDGDADRGDAESASKVLDGIIEQGSRAGVIAGDMIRKRIAKLVKKKSPKPNS